MRDGEAIAVKRFSKPSVHGINEVKTEVTSKTSVQAIHELKTEVTQY